ncbi:helix-turn-helix domain-containing protein [Amycolatopsis sp. H20-H5]|uniref:helix-turn-helix domain-containing protein n=1 Tax=Amycolatopsis sp. H20-H5 TaxID=3046309 RepID=UPI002DBB42E7|nr:helix-turn-helix transcriptional regulator [Amycolatopsis sp. H20-H5]MEC3974911.1 helix-turn-helix transcriptional regulator [Amycolatopsis sp. H20-H5]
MTSDEPRDLDWALANLPTSAVLADKGYRRDWALRVTADYLASTTSVGTLARKHGLHLSTALRLIRSTGTDIRRTGRPPEDRTPSETDAKASSEADVKLRDLAGVNDAADTTQQDELACAGTAMQPRRGVADSTPSTPVRVVPAGATSRPVQFGPRVAPQAAQAPATQYPVTTQHAEAFANAVGDALRARREALRWTRKDLIAQGNLDVSVQTLTTYELGTRNLPLSRLIQCCGALGIRPGELLDKAFDAMAIGSRAGLNLRVDMSALAATTNPALAPLRDWARLRIAAATPKARVNILVPGAALQPMAAQCGLTVEELMATLRADTHDDMEVGT